MDFQLFHFFIPPNIRDGFQSDLPVGNKPYFDEVYKEWVDNFIRRACIFSGAQFSRHREIVMATATREIGCLDADTVLEYYEYELDGIAERMGLNQHRHAHVRYLEYLDGLHDPNRPLLVSRKDVLLKYMERLTSDVPSPDFFTPMLDGYWFNKMMTPGLYGDVSELRQMPYQDYLETRHWRAVRSAMMMLNSGRCQAAHGYLTDSWWFGSESQLNVHHLTYANRGNERFEDLLLLCNGCHEKTHAHGIRAAMLGSEWLLRREAGILW